MEDRLQSAASFVEGGVQDANDDACSICLEEFCQSDPSTMTCCKHEFHLQCILEWCQRSSQCPMCWQAISMQDPTSQELFEAVERERTIRLSRSRSAAILHHPTLGGFELQHLPVGVNDSELEERIIQHLASAAAAMGRPQGRLSAHGHPQFLAFSNNPNANFAHGGDENRTEAPHPQSSGQAHEATLPYRDSANTSNRPIIPNSRSFAGQSSLRNQDGAGPSDLQSYAESIKSHLNSVSMRYRDSITKSTRGWRERFLSRTSSMSDIGSEVRKEFNAGIATVSRMMERLDTRDNTPASSASGHQSIQGHPISETSNERVTASCPASSGPS